MSRNEYQDSLILLKKINNLVLETSWLYKQFIWNEYDLFASYQQLIFGKIKHFYQTGKNASLKRVNLKTACILFFLAIISLLAVWFKRKTKILVFSVDKANGKYKNDFRLRNLYSILSRDNLPYLECFHTLVSFQSLRSFFARRRLGIYLEALQWLGGYFSKKKIEDDFSSISFSNFSKREEVFVKTILTSYLRRVRGSIWTIHWLNKKFSRMSLKILLSIDDVRYYTPVVIACQQSKIRTYAIQHGHFTKYHVGWLEMYSSNYTVPQPEIFLLFSLYWKEELLRLKTYFHNKQLMVGGFTESIREPSLTENRDDIISVLIPYETEAPKEEVISYLKELKKEGKIKIIFKLRPDLDPKKQLQEYEFSQEDCLVLLELDLKKYPVDIVIGTYSSFLYDMIAKGIPVGILKTSIDYGEGMIKNKLAKIINQRDSLIKQIKEIASLSVGSRKSQYLKLVGRKPKSLTKILTKVIKENEIF